MAVEARAKNAKFDAGQYQGLTAKIFFKFTASCIFAGEWTTAKSAEKPEQDLFQISGAGHEGVQAARGSFCAPGTNWVYPY